jgi:cytochrome c-type biogenesis protein CcmH/NrfG
MLADPTEEQQIQALAETDLALACEKARTVVADRPKDESAAELLTKLVRRLAATAPVLRQGPPDVAPAVSQAADLIASGDMERAEILLRQHLKAHRNDPPAMHLMAEIAARCGFREDAERILNHSAQIHAASVEAWASLGRVLHRIACARDYPDYIARSIAALDEAVRRHPGHEGSIAYKAAILVQVRDLAGGRAAYEELLKLHPYVSAHWMNYAYLLKTIGEFGAAVAAYRTSVALDPANGAAWWGMANLKLATFFPSDIELMEEVLDGDEVTDTSRIEINFALAKALDQAKEFERAAKRLKDGNDLRASLNPPDAEMVTGDVNFVTSVFTREFFEERKGWGDPSPDPIFILGMPRSGSTLLEQILSSHSAIEGTEELFILLQLAGEIAHGHRGKQPEEIMLALGQNEVAGLGKRYVDLARRYRLTDRPFFTDKNPSNWRYTGLIHCMLPNAKIIDIRRNPMDCCFANYAQHFQVGANFSYNQADLGRYYTEYVRMMRHFDEVLPGRVHRVIYDDLVENFEEEVRRLLDYLGLPFEEGCLRFFETKRAVHTPSSEQVRQPINKSGFGRWRNYDPWLGELKSNLAQVMENWR